MKIESAYTLWQQFQTGSTEISPAVLAQDVSHSFMKQVAERIKPDFRAISLLCEISLYKNSFQVRTEGIFALYKNIIEVLCDDFSSRYAELCNHVLLHMVDFMCDRKEGVRLKKLLGDLQLNRDDLLKRYQRIKDREPLGSSLKSSIKKIFVLSRVTVGADIAMTSIIVHRLLDSFPRAEIVVCGPNHIPEFFYGLSRLNWLKFHYQRDGGLPGRFSGFTSLYQLMKKEWHGSNLQRVLFFDTDTRLSQLGLLPLFNEENYCYFPSRVDQPSDAVRLSDMVNKWLNFLLSEDKYTAPRISIRPAHSATVHSFLGQFPGKTKKIVLNFGVGNDNRKRLNDPFEERLVFNLLQNKNALVILDSGIHPNEQERAWKLMEKIGDYDFHTAVISEKNLASRKIPFKHGFICVQERIGTLSALIDQADVFFGYDSCCQHIATARKVNSVICFTGAPNDRFFQRWRPVNTSGSTQTIRIKDNSHMTRSELIEMADMFSEKIYESLAIEKTAV